MTANNHGSLEQVKDQWYIFYHRQTHNSTYSRQACAEPVTIGEDGSIAQAECTSCGLNGGPLRADGTYSAGIACNLTNGHMPHATNRVVNADIPYITHEGEGQIITNIKKGTMIGFKYFAFRGSYMLRVVTRGGGCGEFTVRAGDQTVGVIPVAPSDSWRESETVSLKAGGTLPLTFTYSGSGSTEMKEFTMETKAK